MAFNIKMEGENIEAFLDEILKDVEDVEDNFLKKSAKVMKESVERNLNNIRTDNKGPEYKHMADDVISRIVKDQYGFKVARIRGGRKTGTLWHIVNDGTYRTRPTHFMDLALRQTEHDLEKIVDEEMKKGGF